MHYNELDGIHHNVSLLGGQLEFLKSIIKANKLHEPHCAAFSLPKDHSGPFGSFASASEKYCHCWLDLDNRAPEGEGYGIVDIKTSEIAYQSAYTNQYYAVEDLLLKNPHLSKEPSDENYWRKTYYVLPVRLTPTESAE